MTINTAATYRGARQRIVDRGWTTHQWTGPAGEECLVQALGMHAGVTNEGDDTTTQLPKAVMMPLVRELGLEPEEHTRLAIAAALWTWNDQPGRTVDEVTALLQRVASRLEAEAEPVYVPQSWLHRRLFTGSKKEPAQVAA
ncbi:MAG TPA: hypothetical protein PLU21_00060 [Candidatus Saccharibacteria bacterium]|nr:hypothetical protein [Candidatus Saccharibacteria bacterium]